MLSFAIVSSNEMNRKGYNNIINKIMMKEELFYDVFSFDCINKRFNELCNKYTQSTIFILDDNKDIDIIDTITKIRKEYNLVASFIIIIDRNKKYNVIDLASKFSFLIDIINDEAIIDKQIEKDIKYILSILYNRKKVLVFTQDKNLYRIPYCDILYIEKEVNGKKCKIVTKNKTYFIIKNLSDLHKELDQRFIKVHQSALININNITKINFDVNEIIFTNDIICNLLSRSSKKMLKKLITK